MEGEAIFHSKRYSIECLNSFPKGATVYTQLGRPLAELTPAVKALPYQYSCTIVDQCARIDGSVSEA